MVDVGEVGMPMDQKAAALRAVKHLGAFGDTDLFPTLPEMKCFVEKAEDVAEAFAVLTVGNYRPSNCVETLTPKSWLGFRIAHQLTAHDNIVYLASVVAAGPALEASRSAEENMRAVAYRFKDGNGARVFKRGRSFHDWINFLTEFGKSDEPFNADPVVVLTDISDFYQRIYFHRLENVLGEAGVEDKNARLIKKLIQKVRAKQSFGIPVGTSASRLLAECVLSDTDQFIEGLGFQATRYVDDFRILVNSDLEAHSAICKIAEHLMVTEGLSLNVSKTRFQTAAELHASAKKRLQDVFTSNEMLEIEAYIRLNYGEDEVESEDNDDFSEEDVADPFFMDADDLLNKLKEISDGKSVDLSIYKAILRALRFMPQPNVKRLLDEQAELLYYIPREFCLLVRAGTSEENHDIIKAKMLDLLNRPPFSDMAYVRAWILDLFARGTLKSDKADFANYDFSRSVGEKRYDLLLKGIFDDKPFFRSRRAKFSEFSDWEKPAALLGAMCLPQDEYHTWVDSVSDEIPGPFAKIFAAWLKSAHGNLAELLAIPN